ncbi:Clr5 domain-containing protein [Daldinia decipiens]|uniref:Clr5 domain-containing protein n=1 Tax=Daldinia decipiens TaxID=326647 RepID=UPI0020C54242|nr:Clr5 domain-containing protein [Daldinia decipiens]KAI1653593.1 Clr5 domain-containing protein [Daldinia decipiens]
MATSQRYNGPAKDGDWNNNRDTITMLYLEQNKSLKEVMRIMREEYDFYATEKMYKIRFNRWGLHKKLRAHQVAELLVQRGRRAAVGKPSVSFVHGRKVDADRLNAYLRRVSPTSRKELMAILSGKIESAEAQKRSIEEIICRTPSPKPEPASIPRRVEAPDSLRLPEECMQIVQSYVGGALEGSLWQLTPDKELVFPRRPRTWLDPVSSARQLFFNGFTKQGFRLIRITFEDYREVMMRQDPSLLIETCLALGALIQSGPGLAESLINYACGMSRIIFGPRHPLYLLFMRLKGASPSEITRFIGLIIQGFLQVVQADSRLKPTWLATIYRAMLNSNFIEMHTAQKYMQDLIADLENSPSPSVYSPEQDAIRKDIDLLRHHLSWLTNLHNKPTEAAASARTLVETCGGRDPRLARFSCYNMLRTLPTSHEISAEEAVDLMTRSLEICETEFGRNDNATVTLLATLQSYLRRVGRIEDAQRVRADFEERWDEVMDDMSRLKT